MSKPTNINELRDQLNQLFVDATNDSDNKDMRRVKSAASVAGKIIGTLVTQIEYSANRGEKPNIAYLNVSDPE